MARLSEEHRNQLDALLRDITSSCLYISGQSHECRDEADNIILKLDDIWNLFVRTAASYK